MALSTLTISAFRTFLTRMPHGVKQLSTKGERRCHRRAPVDRADGKFIVSCQGCGRREI